MTDSLEKPARAEKEKAKSALEQLTQELQNLDDDGLLDSLQAQEDAEMEEAIRWISDEDFYLR